MTAECCVCLGELTDACTGPCGHKFCRDCILQVLGMAAPEWSGNCPLCRVYLSVYNLSDVNGEKLAKPDVSTIYGCIFVQSGRLGQASYHFDSEDDCYISYAQAPRSWKLDDGNCPPAKKAWCEPRYDPKLYTFTGVVHWDPPFQGDVRWDYEVVFAEDLTGVVGGKVVSTSNSGEQSTTPFSAPWDHSWNRGLAYLRWSPPPTSIFGNVYVQGAMYASFLEGVASYHFDSETDGYISYSNAPAAWLLEDGSRPPQKKPFQDMQYDADRRTFKATVTWDPPFMAQSRWEYEMVFSEDFSCICGGHLKVWGPGMVELPSVRFHDPSEAVEGAIARRGLYYVQKPGALVISQRVRALLPHADGRRHSDAQEAAAWGSEAGCHPSLKQQTQGSFQQRTSMGQQPLKRSHRMA
eukprot:CAMPEP_0178450564 /NCGR_PEP_ID=MMETSP0689_2-20121128/43192_1 /TAXON_ID=160604 /ORGANISM="Amphidinium massartii, Strain CS-259" /LENGTH=408 /DNA_ID=CAMNT_0020076039 /DNA_START=20 /DNA_END=1243 /DNA_ORIENTATION=-